MCLHSSSDTDAHPGFRSLYITIGSLDAPQNNQGFYLHVNDEEGTVNLIWKNPETGKKEVAAFWEFEDLKNQLFLKFQYNEIEFSRAPQFSAFLSLVKDGIITYDWRGYTAKEGKYAGKNHGNAWRMKPQAKSALFGEIETVQF